MIPHPGSKQEINELPIFVEWMGFTKWLLLTTDKFPKKMRFTFSERINTIALDLVEDLVEARYSRNKSHLLKKANLNLQSQACFGHHVSLQLIEGQFHPSENSAQAGCRWVLKKTDNTGSFVLKSKILRTLFHLGVRVEQVKASQML